MTWRTGKMKLGGVFRSLRDFIGCQIDDGEPIVEWASNEVGGA